MRLTLLRRRGPAARRRRRRGAGDARPSSARSRASRSRSRSTRSYLLDGLGAVGTPSDQAARSRPRPARRCSPAAADDTATRVRLPLPADAGAAVRLTAVPSRPCTSPPLADRLPLATPQAELTLAPGRHDVRRAATGRARPTSSRRVGYVATLAQPPGRHRRAAGAPGRGAGGRARAGRARRTGRRWSSSRSTPAGPTGRGSTGARCPRPREVLGLLRTVLFAPEDLALVKGDPAERRRFLDDLLVARAPRFAGVRADYDRVLKQRNALLKSRRPRPRRAVAQRTCCDPRGLGHPPGHRRRRAARRPARPRRRRCGRCVDKAYDDGQPPAAGRRALDYASVARAPSVRAARRPRRRWPTLLLGGDRRGADGGARARRHAGRPAPRRPRADARAAAGQGLREPRRVLVVRPGAAAGVVRPARADGDAGGEPVLVLDDVFAELDVGRRERLAAAGRARPSRCWSRRRWPPTCPSALAGARVDVVREGTLERG